MDDVKLSKFKTEKLILYIVRSMMALCCLFLVLMMVHVGADIAAKLILNSPLTGTLETVSYYYMVSLVFLALPYVELRGEHVSVDLFFQKFPPNLKIFVYVTGTLLAAAYYGLFAYTTFLDALKATEQLETVMANFLFYVWPSRWALPIGSSALVLMLVLNAVKTCLSLSLPVTEQSDPTEAVI
ncbi:TRAP transporter small permease [Sneathiella glossodoripedis]|uniref:TRAP transporter small permease n=1 Tax=Sneathiella glossodoripedis TaxID=418853 RepID=UPI00131EEBF1|nr:TRAP transporter small permease [Sneathiella glossodoripedis]